MLVFTKYFCLFFVYMFLRNCIGCLLNVVQCLRQPYLLTSFFTLVQCLRQPYLLTSFFTLVQCLRQPYLLTSFFTLVFLSIQFHIFLVVALMVQGAVRVWVISMLYQGFIHLLKSLSNSLVKVLLLMLLLCGMLLMRFVRPPLYILFQKKSLNPNFYTKAYPPLSLYPPSWSLWYLIPFCLHTDVG